MLKESESITRVDLPSHYTQKPDGSPLEIHQYQNSNI